MDIKTMMEAGVFLAGIIGSLFYMRFNIERCKEEVEKQWGVIGDWRKWKEDHTKEAYEVRAKHQEDIGKIREDAVKTGGRLEEIFRMVGEILKKVDKLEAK